jgi:hypothetical protein
MVWKGGETTTGEMPIPVGSFPQRSSAHEMAQLSRKLSAEGTSDQEMAPQVTAVNDRSPRRSSVLPSPVKSLRLTHGLFQKRRQSHPRSMVGYLTVPQIAQALDLTKHWIDDRLRHGCIQVTKDAQTGLYVFPNQPSTLAMFKPLAAGHLDNLRFSEEYQDA